MKTLKILVAFALPMALVSGSVADAAPKAAAKVKWGFVKKLIAAGALPASALQRLTAQDAKIGACYTKAAAAKQSGKEACRPLRRDLVGLQSKIYKSAKPKTPEHTAKVAKFNKWLDKRLARIKAKLANAPKVPTPIKK